MNRSLPPQEWVAPHWHPDFGDVIAELEHLRILAVAFTSQVHEATFALEIPEEGLMFLRIKFPSNIVAEVHSIVEPAHTDSRRYGVFVSPGTSDEVEYYTTLVDDVVKFLLRLSM